MKTIFLVHLGATLCLVGLIWTIQIVHYPLMDHVTEEFEGFHDAHSAAISWLVIPLMLAELGTGILLLLQRPSEIPGWSVWTGLLLIAVIWGSTAILQVPRHQLLAKGFDVEVHHALVASNWLRTMAWTLRGVLVLWWVERCMASRW